MVLVRGLMLANESSMLTAFAHFPLRWNAVRSFAEYFVDEIRGGAVALWPRRMKVQGSNRGISVWHLHVLPHVCTSSPRAMGLRCGGWDCGHCSVPPQDPTKG